MSKNFLRKATLYSGQIINYITSKAFLSHAPFVILIAFLFLTNTFHESYPDEFDNILGGWYIIQGKLPYIGFFTHHGPVPYFIAAFVTLFSGQSFVLFRIIYSLLLVGFMLWSFFSLRKRLGREETQVYPYFIVLFGLFATYYWSHMLLADNIAALFLTPAYILLVVKSLYKKPYVHKDFIFISILSSLALYSSLSYIYVYVIIIALTLHQNLKNIPHKFKDIVFASVKPLVIILVPHLLFLVYLVLSGSLFDYLYQNFRFNTEFYVYNYPRAPGSTFINPIRFAVVIANSFFNNFHTLLLSFKDFNLAYPVNLTMALANVSMIIYLLLKKRYALSLFVLLVLIYANARSNVLESKETDYQSAVYIFMSFFNLLFVLRSLHLDLNEKIEDGKKVIYGILLGILGVYSFFCLLTLIGKFNEKAYAKYMGTASLIYNRPRIAPILNLVTDKTDYAWIGPFEFEELFYMDAQIPSKHHILIRGVGLSDKLNKDMVDDFREKMPKVIYFDKNFHYLGSKTEIYSSNFIQFLNDYYVTPADYKVGGNIYRSVIPVDIKMDLETKLFIRKDKIREVLPVLIKNNYLREDNI